MKSLKEALVHKHMDRPGQKYEITTIVTAWNGHTLYHIKALKNIPSKGVKKGDYGGWIESYDNLDQKGDCWIEEDAFVYGNAKVSDNAYVYDKAKVFGNAKVYGDAEVYGHAQVCSEVWVYDNAKVYDKAQVYGDAIICGHAKINYDVNKGKIDE